MPDIFVAKKPKKKLTLPRRQGEPVEPIARTLPRSDTAFSAFITRPKRVNFETQDREEKVILLLRRHWLTNIPWLLLVILMAVAPVFSGFIPIGGYLPDRYVWVTLLGWSLLTTAVFLEKSLSWLFNVNLITDERIVDIDFPSLLYRHISSAKIDHIEDVSVGVGGFVRSLFNYGDVVIQTAGAEQEICFEAVPHPAQVVSILNELMLEEEQEKLEGRVR